MPNPVRHLVRSACALLLLAGLGVSVAESTICEAGPVAGVAGATASDTGADCCPCIHTFPVRAPAAPLASVLLPQSLTGIQPPAQFLTSHTAAPLVPPPIA